MEIDQARGESCHRRHHTFDPTFDPPPMPPASASASARVSHYYIFISSENPTNLSSLHFTALEMALRGNILENIDEHETTEYL